MIYSNTQSKKKRGGGGGIQASIQLSIHLHIYFFLLQPRIYIEERIRISYFLALSRMERFYATTEQKLIHSF